MAVEGGGRRELVGCRCSYKRKSQIVKVGGTVSFRITHTHHTPQQ